LIHPEDIKHLIENGVTESTVMVSGDDGQHFSAIVISPIFAGKNRIQKQQLVYQTLGTRIHDGTIHAISIKTFTPEEWQQQEMTNHG
jgi:acid stress-induced BolA-like protein IbaG/YrbA